MERFSSTRAELESEPEGTSQRPSLWNAKGIQTFNSLVALWKIPAALLSVASARNPEQPASPTSTRTAGRVRARGAFLFANALSHAGDAVPGICYFPGKPVANATNLRT